MAKKIKTGSRSEQMPDVHVGGHIMKWDQYWTMLKEMEKQQVPFKKWIEEEFTPAYGKDLRKKFSKSVAKSHADIAGLFFDRVLHVGFLNFESIRHAFAVKEFPQWWHTHVLGVAETPKQVASSIKHLLDFAKETYDMEAIGKWPEK